jgi:hypothetical protein
MDRDLTTLATTPTEMEVIPGVDDGKTLSFHAPEGYFILTDNTLTPEGSLSHFYDVNEATYEDDSISLYFGKESKFQDVYDVVKFYWAVDKKIGDFLAGHLFLGTPLRLSLNVDGRSRLQ